AVEVIYTMSETGTGGPSEDIVVREGPIFGTDGPGTHNVFLGGGKLERDGLLDMPRQQIRLAVAGEAWPYDPDLTDVEVELPGTMPSNVENGVGFVGGVATWIIPYHRRDVPHSESTENRECTVLFNRHSASLAGRVVRAPCGEAHLMADIRLT